MSYITTDGDFFNTKLIMLSKVFLEYNFYFLSVVFLVSFIIFYSSKILPIHELNQNSIFNFIKTINFFCIIISFILHMCNFWFFCLLSYNNDLGVSSDVNLFYINSIDLSYQNNLLVYPDSNTLLSKYQVSIDFFGFIILTLAYIIGFISLIVLDTRLYWKNIKYVFYFNIFLLIVYIYVTTSNFLIFFLCYELLLIPSFLIVYFISPSRRAIQASLYFIIWTQLGSLLVLIGICYMISITNIYEFSNLYYWNFTSIESTIIIFLFFFGFGFKAPI